MAKMLFFTLTVLIISGIVWYAAKVLMPQSPPQLDLEEWWGPKEMKGKEDRSIRPFQVNFSAELITDLRQRLKSHRPAVLPLEDVGFQYGFNSKALAPWVKYWAEDYPFAERQKFLNKYPQFKTNVQGLDIHFIRVKPEVSDKVNVVPLLLLHGWPGSVREFYEAIPLLTKQQDGYDFAFEVIVPSLPGYGFSDPAVRPGLGPAQMGVIFRNLMKRLGLKQFYVQGGDWGAGVAGAMTVLFPRDPAVRPGLGPAQMGVIFRNLMKQLGLKQFYMQGGDWGAGVAGAMTVLFPRDVLGYHSNMLFVSNGWSQLRTVLGAFIPSLVVEPHLTDRMYPLTKFFAYLMEEFGYFHLQATKPDTVGIALTDSPTGLLAYILEKFSSWTKFENRALQDGGLSKFTREQLIDNLMMYWASNSITTSMRLYSEAMTDKNRKLGLDKYTTPVPTWALQAKNELFYQPPSILRIKFTNLLGNTVLDEGGHFIAFELPDVFAKDVFKAVQKFRAFHGMKTEL